MKTTAVGLTHPDKFSRTESHPQRTGLGMGLFTQQLHTECEINARADLVWQVLTDFEHYPQWNPFIQSIRGEIKTGAKLQIQLRTPKGMAMKFLPTVLQAEPNRELRWLGRLGLPRIFDGEHSFTIEPINQNRVRFVQQEVFIGVLIPLLVKSLDTDTRQGFELMNQALKHRVEQLALTQKLGGD